jgi:hypothetical protein
MSLDPISAIADLANTVVGKIWPDKSEQEKLALQNQLTIELAQTDLVKSQLAVNQAEAANPSWFVAGARPAVMWICAVALALYYWPTFILGEVLWVQACMAGHGLVAHPDLGIGDLMGVLAPLLGISTLRTVDKIKGTDTKHIG